MEQRDGDEPENATDRNLIMTFSANSMEAGFVSS